jgi:para-aminobenzoate synthetase component 1
MSTSGVFCQEIDPRKPVDVALLWSDQPHLAFLDSGRNFGNLGRYSYVAADPFGVFEVINDLAYWNTTQVDLHPFEALRELVQRYSLATDEGLPPFQTGAIGFLSYEASQLIEAVPNMPKAESGMPDLKFGFYDVVFAHDHLTHRSMILSSGWPETDPHKREKRAKERMVEFLNRLDAPPPQRSPNPSVDNWILSTSRHGFEASVAAIIERIFAGDLFQANLAQCFHAELSHAYDPLGFYAQLRAVSPATFGAYLDFGDLQIASNSPERFMSLSGRQIEARPIKGTAPRGDTPEADRALSETLLHSVKDRAENTMIVDLLRNDLSRVSSPFSVNVPILCGLETYASVHHLVSVVEAELAVGRDAIDLIKAAFPCGSITGAPKIKARELIAHFEKIPRGIYCGSIGYIGFDGTMDLNVAIRTVTFSDKMARFHAGGGITALSNPHEEYEETMIKAARIFSAFRHPDGDGGNE